MKTILTVIGLVVVSINTIFPQSTPITTMLLACFGYYFVWKNFKNQSEINSSLNKEIRTLNNNQSALINVINKLKAENKNNGTTKKEFKHDKRRTDR